jgi:regulator of replication initiation timing
MATRQHHCYDTILHQTPVANIIMADTNMYMEEMMAEMARLKMENANLKKKTGSGALKMKVSQKGAVSIYGLNKFPVTLYAEQWAKIFSQADNIMKFIADNAEFLQHKCQEKE